MGGGGGGVQALAGSSTSHWSSLGTSYFLRTFRPSDYQRVFLQEPLADVAVAAILGHSHFHQHKPTRTFLLTLNPISHPPECPGPLVACHFPSFVSLLVHESPQYLMAFPTLFWFITFLEGPHPQDIHSGKCVSRNPHETQRSTLLPLENISRGHRHISSLPPFPLGITSTMWHQVSCALTRCSWTTIMVPQCSWGTQAGEKCMPPPLCRPLCHLGSRAAPVKSAAPVPTATLPSHNRGWAGERDHAMLSSSRAAPIRSPHLCRDLFPTLSPLHGALSPGQGETWTPLGPARIPSQSPHHILRFSRPVDDRDWHSPPLDLLAPPEPNIHGFSAIVPSKGHGFTGLHSLMKF